MNWELLNIDKMALSRDDWRYLCLGNIINITFNDENGFERNIGVGCSNIYQYEQYINFTAMRNSNSLPLYFAILSRNDTLKKLLLSMTNVESISDILLILAVCADDPELVSEMIKLGNDVNESIPFRYMEFLCDGKQLTHHCIDFVYKYYFEIHGINFYAHEITRDLSNIKIYGFLLHVAIQLRSSTILDILLQHNIDTKPYDTHVNLLAYMWTDYNISSFMQNILSQQVQMGKLTANDIAIWIYHIIDEKKDAQLSNMLADFDPYINHELVEHVINNIFNGTIKQYTHSSIRSSTSTSMAVLIFFISHYEHFLNHDTIYMYCDNNDQDIELMWLSYMAVLHKKKYDISKWIDKCLLLSYKYNKYGLMDELLHDYDTSHIAENIIKIFTDFKAI